MHTHFDRAALHLSASVRCIQRGTLSGIGCSTGAFRHPHSENSSARSQTSPISYRRIYEYGRSGRAGWGGGGVQGGGVGWGCGGGAEWGCRSGTSKLREALIEIQDTEEVG